MLFVLKVDQYINIHGITVNAMEDRFNDVSDGVSVGCYFNVISRNIRVSLRR